jgi:hypothetical protein
VFDISVATFMAIDVHNVVEATKKGCKQHHRDRNPGKFALPVKKDRDKGNREDNKKASHDRDAGFVFASFHRKGGIVRVIAYNFVFVEEFCENWSPKKGQKTRNQTIENGLLKELYRHSREGHRGGSRKKLFFRLIVADERGIDKGRELWYIELFSR